MKKCTFRAALIASSCLLLTACSTFEGTSEPKGPESATDVVPLSLVPAKGKPFLTLFGSGIQTFRCVKDARGFFWKFENTQAALKDETGNPAAQISGPMHAIDHLDGSRIISTRIFSWVSSSQNPGDNKNLLMEAVADDKPGALERVLYVQRLKSSGGIPTQECGPAQLNKFIKVPFKADYVFWK